MLVHSSACSDQLFAGTPIALGPFLCQSVVPHSYMLVPIFVLHCCDNFHLGISLRTF